MSGAGDSGRLPWEPDPGDRVLPEDPAAFGGISDEEFDRILTAAMDPAAPPADPVLVPGTGEHDAAHPGADGDPGDGADAGDPVPGVVAGDPDPPEPAGGAPEDPEGDLDGEAAAGAEPAEGDDDPDGAVPW
ncbi:hypothetical protein [Corynebacterium sphenisci]|uniref:hypothetical protein n=1 Tax=Corynebacterium sphenisci TaxID=191493 RepID=UPI0009530142|nr:hypothetical protein [Corynebacterium sphenisci]